MFCQIAGLGSVERSGVGAEYLVPRRGIRLTALMISKGIPDTSVPMSLLADHPDVRFNYLLPGIGTCDVEMH